MGVEPVSDDDSFDSDNEGQLSKPSVGDKTIKRHFAKILKSKDGTIPDKFIFFNDSAMRCDGNIYWKINDLLEKIL